MFKLVNVGLEVDGAQPSGDGRFEITTPAGAGSNMQNHDDEDWARVSQRKADRDRVPGVLTVTRDDLESLRLFTTRQMARDYRYKNLKYAPGFAAYRSVKAIPAAWFFPAEDPEQRKGQYFTAEVTGRRRRDMAGKKLKSLGAYFEVIVAAQETWLLPVAALDTLSKLHAKGGLAAVRAHTTPPAQPIRRFK